MKRFSMVLTAVVLLAVVGSVPGHTQQPSPPMSATTIIDGSQHPELIPDSLAYRLYFITVTSLPPNVGMAKLRFAGLSPTDAQAAYAAATTFRTAYDSLSNGYNAQVTAGSNPDIIAFGTQRDTLVSNMQTTFQSTLTTLGMQILAADIQNEKKHMKTSGVTTMPQM